MKNKHACFYSRKLPLISPDAIPSGPSLCDVFETIPSCLSNPSHPVDPVYAFLCVLCVRLKAAPLGDGF
jgi:hypothetical protein